MPSLGECAAIAVVFSVIISIMYICDKYEKAKREREEAERVARRRAKIEELVKKVEEIEVPKPHCEYKYPIFSSGELVISRNPIDEVFKVQAKG